MVGRVSQHVVHLAVDAWQRYGPRRNKDRLGLDGDSQQEQND